MSYEIRSTGRIGMLFTNWSSTYFCRPHLFFVPHTVEDLKQILNVAHLENRKVRVVGCGHSPSDLACCSDYLISMRHFDKVLAVDVEQSRVKVEGGVILTDLNTYLEKHGLALSILGSVSTLTLAGAISTGTHGSGIGFGNLSTYVVSMDILTSSGEIIEVSKEKDSETFQAACCSLGAFGIILTITYQCEKTFALELSQYSCPLQQVLENLDVHLKSSEHFRFLWFPYTGSTSVSHINRTSKKITRTSHLAKCHSWLWEYFFGYYILEFSYWISTFYPKMVPFINNLFYRLLYSKSRRYVGPSNEIFNFECLFKQYVNEWSIPVERTAVALFELEEWLSNTSHFYAHFPIEVRFVKKDNLMLSPANGRNSCYINIIMYRPYGKNVEHQLYWNAYEEIMLRNGGRPHWAKAHRMTAKDLKSVYPQYSTWCKLRKKLDPTDTFVNSYLERIL